MTPDSKTPPTDEAVKAAFAMVDCGPLKRMGDGVPAAFEAIRPHIELDEDCVDAAARILAAHARALQYRAEQAEIRLEEIDAWNDAQPEHQVMPDEFYTKATAMLRNRREKFEIADLIAHGLSQLAEWRGIAERLGSIVECIQEFCPAKEGMDALSALETLKEKEKTP